jgi:hypothetical protein
MGPVYTRLEQIGTIEDGVFRGVRAKNSIEQHRGKNRVSRRQLAGI